MTEKKSMRPFSEVLNEDDKRKDTGEYVQEALDLYQAYIFGAHKITCPEDMQAHGDKFLSDQDAAFQALKAKVIANMDKFHAERMEFLRGMTQTYDNAPWIKMAQRQV